MRLLAFRKRLLIIIVGRRNSVIYIIYVTYERRNNYKMSKFTITEQAILLITRKDLNEEQMNYLREILNSCEMDWSYFVGSLIYNRVNGIAYKNLVKMGGVTRRIMFPLEAAYENIKKRTNLHCSEILKLDKYFEEAGINYAF